MKYQIIERTEYGYKVRETTPEQEAIQNWAALGVIVIGLVVIMLIL